MVNSSPAQPAERSVLLTRSGRARWPVLVSAGLPDVRLFYSTDALETFPSHIRVGLDGGRSWSPGLRLNDNDRLQAAMAFCEIVFQRCRVRAFASRVVHKHIRVLQS